MPGRLTRDELDAAFPLLARGLAAHPQVGLVVTRRRGGALVVEGSRGSVVLARTIDGDPVVLETDGEDPLAAYGDEAARDLLDLERRDHVGDLVLFGHHDPALGEVVAFEELVGSHGGLGGWQTEALLVHPTGWPLRAGMLTGREVHDAVLARLGVLGLRREHP
jgi:hypothetical protein